MGYLAVHIPYDAVATGKLSLTDLGMVSGEVANRCQPVNSRALAYYKARGNSARGNRDGTSSSSDVALPQPAVVLNQINNQPSKHLCSGVPSRICRSCK